MEDELVDLQSSFFKIFKVIFLNNSISGRNQEHLTQAYKIARWLQWEIQLQLPLIEREELEFHLLCKPQNHWQWEIAPTNII